MIYFDSLSLVFPSSQSLISCALYKRHWVKSCKVWREEAHDNWIDSSRLPLSHWGGLYKWHGLKINVSEVHANILMQLFNKSRIKRLIWVILQYGEKTVFSTCGGGWQYQQCCRVCFAKHTVYSHYWTTLDFLILLIFLCLLSLSVFT